MKIKLTQEQIDTLSYDDVAYLILEAYGKSMKIQDLFKRVIKAMELSEEVFTSGIGDFFELMLTDKRFTMLENGYWDLKINHSTKIVFDDEEEEEDIDISVSDDLEVEEDNSEINYDEDTVEDDDADELEDLVILDENDENDML